MERKKIICLFLSLMLVMVTAQGFANTDLLKKGATGDKVSKLQQKLAEYGYLTETPDGNFGENTWSAVIQFQMDCGLEADGIIGTKTWQFLNEFKSLGITASRGSDRKGQQVVAYAKSFLGVPYVWGGRSSTGFDCSGFISCIYKHFGMSLPRMADEQYNVGITIANKAQLREGDLVFFTTYEPGPSHVGIYAGNGQFIHASSGAGSVVLTPLAKQYYSQRYLGGRRIVR